MTEPAETVAPDSDEDRRLSLREGINWRWLPVAFIQMVAVWTRAGPITALVVLAIGGSLAGFGLWKWSRMAPAAQRALLERNHGPREYSRWWVLGPAIIGTVVLLLVMTINVAIS